MKIEIALDESTILVFSNPDALGILEIKTRDNEDNSEWHEFAGVVVDDQKTFERFISIMRAVRDLMILDERIL